jgi:ABC-type histidine transport system ATPase subunit
MRLRGMARHPKSKLYTKLVTKDHSQSLGRQGVLRPIRVVTRARQGRIKLIRFVTKARQGRKGTLRPIQSRKVSRFAKMQNWYEIVRNGKTSQQ